MTAENRYSQNVHLISSNGLSLYQATPVQNFFVATDMASAGSFPSVSGAGESFTCVALNSVATSIGRAKRDQYASLFVALNEMVELEEEESLSIDSETYRSACSVLSYLSYSDFPAPRVFSHGGDAVAFTWAHDSIVMHLTVSCGIAALGIHVDGQKPVAVGHVDLAQSSVAKLFSGAKVQGGRAGSNFIT